MGELTFIERKIGFLKKIQDEKTKASLKKHQKTENNDCGKGLGHFGGN